MAHNNYKNLEVYDSDSEFKPSYKQFPKAFRKMHEDTLDTFKKVYLQRKHISKLEKEVCDLNNTLDSLKEEHASLIKERFIVSDTLAENIVKIECDTCPILKLESENLKGELTQSISLPTIVFTSSS